MKTIAKQLGIKDEDFPFIIKDKDGKEVYRENSHGYWEKREFKDGKQVCYENSDGFWYKSKYKDRNPVYYEDSYDGVATDRRSNTTETSIDEQVIAKLEAIIKGLKGGKD